MRNVVAVFAVLGLIAGLSMGCAKKDEPGAAAVESSAKKWEPETAPVPPAHDPNDGKDHSGHNH